jgi:hypothetical protein
MYQPKLLTSELLHKIAKGAADVLEASGTNASSPLSRFLEVKHDHSASHSNIDLAHGRRVLFGQDFWL